MLRKLSTILPLLDQCNYILVFSCYFVSRDGPFTTLTELRRCLFHMVQITGTVDLAGLIKVLILATLSEQHPCYVLLLSAGQFYLTPS